MEIELKNVEATSPLIRKLSSDEDNFTLEKIETSCGTITVAKQGAEHRSSKPVILTYHDIGLNHVSNFQAFFNYMDMRLLLQSFAVFHINAPGQEENSPALPDDFEYPTLDKLAEQIEDVCKYFDIKHLIGFGVGAGANILARFALLKPDYVDGLYLINCTSTQSSWTEWFYQKMNVYYLGSNNGSQFPQSVQDYLMWHHFGKLTPDRNYDLVEVYRKYFTGKHLNGKNLSMFIQSYLRRTDLGIERTNTEKNFKCPVLLMCSALSPHVDDTVNMNSRLNPANSTWMKISDCGMVIEEYPGKVVESLRLFIQGLGLSLSVFERRRSSLRKMSLSSVTDSNDSRKNSIDESALKQIQEVHIVENPIANC